MDWRTNAPKDGTPIAGSYSAADVAVLNTCLPQIPPRMPSTIEKSPLDFANEDPPQTITESGGIEDQGQDRLSWEIPPVDNPIPMEVAPDLGKEMAAMGPTSTLGGKSLAAMGLKTGSTFSAPASQETPDDVSGPDPLSSEVPTGHMATTEVQDLLSAKSPESGKLASIPSGDGLPGGIYQPGWGVINSYLLDTPNACQDVVDHVAPPRYFSELRYLPNADFLSQYNMNLARKVAIGSQLRLRFEQEVRLLKKARAKIARQDQRILMREEEIKKLDQEVKSLQAVEVEVHDLRIQTKNLETLLEAEVNNDQLSQQVMNLQAQVVGEEKMKAAFKAFKKYKDDRVEQQCAEMDARLDKLSVDFNEELYPHMLTAIAGRRWVVRHGLRLAVMKCAESSELRQAFANAVSAGLAKGMSKGLKYGIEHGKAGRDLTIVEAYDPKADGKYVQALQKLKDLKYPLLEQLEKLKYAPIKLKIPIYHEVYNLEDPWAIKEEMPLEDAIAANISRAKKKRKCRVTEDEVSPRLLRSKSLPPMYNLDWP
ncbi:hypothetical protein Tco_0345848 [Tanacetum coccineum]